MTLHYLVSLEEKKYMICSYSFELLQWPLFHGFDNMRKKLECWFRLLELVCLCSGLTLELHYLKQFLVAISSTLRSTLIPFFSKVYWSHSSVIRGSQQSMATSYLCYFVCNITIVFIVILYCSSCFI